MTRETLSESFRQELQRLTGASAASIADDHLLSQIINSSGFLQLLMALEGRLGITIEDEDFYEAAPVTVGDLIDFLDKQVTNRGVSA